MIRTTLFLLLESIEHIPIDSMDEFGLALNSNHYIDAYSMLNKTNTEGNNTVRVYACVYAVNGTSRPVFADTEVKLCNLSSSNNECIFPKKYYTVLFIASEMSNSDGSEVIGLLSALDEMNFKAKDIYYVYIFFIFLLHIEI